MSPSETVSSQERKPGSLPYVGLVEVASFCCSFLWSKYGNPLNFFLFQTVMVSAWLGYRLIRRRIPALICGGLLIAVCLAATLFDNPPQMFLTTIVTVDVLFAFPEIWTWVAVGGEIGVYILHMAWRGEWRRDSWGDTVLNLALIVFFAVAFLFYARASRLLIEKNRQLARQSLTIESLALAKERAEMASQMHDSIGQYLSAMHMELEAAQRTLHKGSSIDRALTHVIKAEDIDKKALAQVRQQARALNPAAFGGELTKESIVGLADSFESTGLHVTATVNGSLEGLSSQNKVLIYRALQETLTNVVRHAHASSASIVIDLAPRTLRLCVTDDGVGPGKGSGRFVPGFGLSSLEQRVKDLGGFLQVGPAETAESSRGTRVILSLPLTADSCR